MCNDIWSPCKLEHLFNVIASSEWNVVMIGMGRYSKPVGKSTKCYPTWQEVGPRRSATGGWACLVDAHGHIQKTVLPVIKCYGSGGWVKSRKGADELLRDERRVVVGREDGTCRTTRSLKDSILSYARSSRL